MTTIRACQPSDFEHVAPLLAAFRVELAKLKNREKLLDLAAAREELSSYLASTIPAYHVWVAVDDLDTIEGFITCRVLDNVVWAEIMFVREGSRRSGIATMLYEKAAALARDCDCDTVYNWIHPNNDKIIAFLRKRGYATLNLMEIRGRLPWEKEQGTITINDHEYSY